MKETEIDEAFLKETRTIIHNRLVGLQGGCLGLMQRWRKLAKELRNDGQPTMADMANEAADQLEAALRSSL